MKKNWRVSVSTQGGNVKIAHCIMPDRKYGQDVTKPLSISDHVRPDPVVH